MTFIRVILCYLKQQLDFHSKTSRNDQKFKFTSGICLPMDYFYWQNLGQVVVPDHVTNHFG